MTTQTIRDRIENVRRLHAKGPNASGQLYNKISETRGAYSRVTLYTLFQSDDDTHLVRDHLFESKKRARTSAEWSVWFGANLATIHASGVLPGMALRTGKAWSVLKILGWAGDESTHEEISRRAPRSNRNQQVETNRRKRRSPGATRRKVASRRGRNTSRVSNRKRRTLSRVPARKK
jgi:hypothetical protein